jgi:two-component system chemotaxis sensor kinase CheA
LSLNLKKYLSLFVAEAGEHLASYAKDLLRVEEASRCGGDARGAIDSCFRHAHSVKGMSASMRLEGISVLAHRVEDLVDVFRRDKAGLDARAVDLLLAAGDRLQDLVQAAARGENPPADVPMMEKLAETTARLE